MIKPILKWPGGKRWLFPKIQEILADKFNIYPQVIKNQMPPCHCPTYYELFIGGGSIFCSLEPKYSTINDLNPDLMNVYSQVKNNKDDLIECLNKLNETYKIAVDSNTQNDFYYLIRKTYNMNLSDKTVEHAAMFIFLNKTCFNGLYRVNSTGKFNVGPNKLSIKQYNAIKNLYKNIEDMSKLLQNTKLLCGDYKKACEEAIYGDIVYLDPPYDYEENGFTSYQKENFTKENTKELRDLAYDLALRGIIVLISNNDTSYIRSLFKEPFWTVEQVIANRNINSDSSNRKGAKEVIIYHKPMTEDIVFDRYPAHVSNLVDEQYQERLVDVAKNLNDSINDSDNLYKFIV